LDGLGAPFEAGAPGPRGRLAARSKGFDLYALPLMLQISYEGREATGGARTMRITIDVDDDRLGKALKRLHIPKGKEDEVKKALAALSTDLYFEWLLNEQRFDSISQVTEHWVAKTEEILFPNDPPNPTKLYDRYSLPLPRARYLARMLMARSAARWRKGARLELLAKFKAIESDARAAEKTDHLDQNFDCILTKPVYDEFQVLYEIARTGPPQPRPLTPPKVISSFLQEVTIRVNGQVILGIIELIDRLKDAP